MKHGSQMLKGFDTLTSPVVGHDYEKCQIGFTVILRNKYKKK
jgi:hypothetical protein